MIKVRENSEVNHLRMSYVFLRTTRLLQLQATVKNSSLTFNDLEDQHTLISLWFQRQVTENRKGRLDCQKHR